MPNEPEQNAEIPFEQALARLERTVAELEGGELPLADALARYEAGIGHLKRCYQLLDQAERRIELVTGIDAEGKPLTQAFDETSASLEERTAKKSRK